MGLADDELVELLLVFGAEVLQALLGFGRDLELVHCECGVVVVGEVRCGDGKGDDADNGLAAVNGWLCGEVK